jgi:hypothetical protein
VSRPYITLAMLAVLAGHPAPAAAHRLDEYLQATRVSIGIARVDLEIDLTPGANIAPTVLTWIDTDGDGRISSVEGKAYAQGMLDSVVLTADGRRAAVTLVDDQFPELTDMSAGTGTIRLRAAATTTTNTSGRHTIKYVNNHHPDTSVYLANALVPADRQITIAGQRRDPLQQTLTLEYAVAYGRRSRALALVAGLALVGIVGMARRSWQG